MVTFRLKRCEILVERPVAGFCRSDLPGAASVFSNQHFRRPDHESVLRRRAGRRFGILNVDESAGCAVIVIPEEEAQGFAEICDDAAICTIEEAQ